MRRRIPAQVRVVPDPEGDLSEGVLIRATVLGRLFGLKVLRLEAEVTVAPAQVEPPVPFAGSNGHGSAGGLAAAARYLEESEATLARATRE